MLHENYITEKPDDYIFFETPVLLYSSTKPLTSYLMPPVQSPRKKGSFSRHDCYNKMYIPTGKCLKS